VVISERWIGAENGADAKAPMVQALAPGYFDVPWFGGFNSRTLLTGMPMKRFRRIKVPVPGVRAAPRYSNASGGSLLHLYKCIVEKPRSTLPNRPWLTPEGSAFSHCVRHEHAHLPGPCRGAPGPEWATSRTEISAAAATWPPSRQWSGFRGRW